MKKINNLKSEQTYETPCTLMSKSRMEVGCQGTWGLELLTPNPLSLDHLRPCPTHYTQSQALPHKAQPSPGTCHTELEEQWRTYWVDNE